MTCMQGERDRDRGADAIDLYVDDCRSSPIPARRDQRMRNNDHVTNEALPPPSADMSWWRPHVRSITYV